MTNTIMRDEISFWEEMYYWNILNVATGYIKYPVSLPSITKLKEVIPGEWDELGTLVPRTCQP